MQSRRGTPAWAFAVHTQAHGVERRHFDCLRVYFAERDDAAELIAGA